MTLSDLANRWKANELQYDIILRNIKRKEQSNA